MSIKLDLTCINISRDSRYMLLNTSECEMQLLDIETREVARQYLGQKQGNYNYIIRSTFGGAAENFVVSGSEGKPEIAPYLKVKYAFLPPFTKSTPMYRFQDSHLAQGELYTCCNSPGPRCRLRQCSIVESEGSGNVRIGRG